MATKMKETTLDFGFVQLPVSVFGAARDDELDLKSLCHGKPPKMTIKCEEGGEVFTSWVKVPQRGYEWNKGEYVMLSPEEIADAKAKRSKVDSMKVEKACDFMQVGSKYVFNKGYYVLPGEKASETTVKTYRTIYEVIKESGKAILVRFMPRDRVRHYAIIADSEGILIAYELVERRQLPYPMPNGQPDPRQKAQGKALIEGLAADDVALEQEPDPLFELVQAKLSQMGSLEGIGQTVIVPE